VPILAAPDFIYPNEVELHWGLLIVLYPYITGLVAGAFILASLAKVFKVKEILPTYRLALLTALAFLIVAPMPLQAHPSRCFSRRTSSRRWRCSASSTRGT
jgi:predicted membrane protein